MGNITIDRETQEAKEARSAKNEKSEKSRQTQREQVTQDERTTTSVEQIGKQEVSGPEGVERTRTGRVYLPAVDIYETNDTIVLVADMPGVDDKSVDVSLEKNVLTIHGRVEPQVPAGHTLAYWEYRVGDYQRSFTISNEIDWEHIEGVVKNGVLRLTLPKAGPATTRKISIKSA